MRLRTWRLGRGVSRRYQNVCRWRLLALSRGGRFIARLAIAFQQLPSKLSLSKKRAKCFFSRVISSGWVSILHTPGDNVLIVHPKTVTQDKTCTAYASIKDRQAILSPFLFRSYKCQFDIGNSRKSLRCPGGISGFVRLFLAR